MKKDIKVTKSIKPRSGLYEREITKILDSNIFTNNGPQCRALEHKLGELLGIKWLALCSNATIGLELALHAAGLAGKTIVTTPFSYVATVSAPLWIGCKIIFVDIDPETLCLDPAKIPTDRNFDGILPVNIYGHPCDYKAIADFGKPVIYDAAQAFGATLDGRSLLDFGDLAVCSFHSTKVFHTFEGGCVVCHSEERLASLQLLRAFGHRDDNHYCLGINGKISEVHAAVGIALLEDFERHREARKHLTEVYLNLLNTAHLRYPIVRERGFKPNYGYFPVIFASEELALKVQAALQERGVTPRRYFYPALNELPYIKPSQACPVAERIARRVLCLPLYSSLDTCEVEFIAGIVNSVCAAY